MITESTYLELLDNCRAFNRRICCERRHRLPFLDPQTRVAQNSSNLWRLKRERQICSPPAPAIRHSFTSGGSSKGDDDYSMGVVYRYPAKRWRKKANSSINLIMSDVKSRLLNNGATTNAANSNVLDNKSDGLTANNNNSSSDNNNNNNASLTNQDENAQQFDHPKMIHSSSNNSNPPFDIKTESNDGSSRLTGISDQQQSKDQSHGNANQGGGAGGWYDDLSDPNVDDPYFDDLSGGGGAGGQMSDADDFNYEEKSSSSSRKKKSAAGGSGKRSSKSGGGGPGPPGQRTRRTNDPDSDKPHACIHCGAKYKTKPGLHYHLNHVHPELHHQGANSQSQHFVTGPPSSYPPSSTPIGQSPFSVVDLQQHPPHEYGNTNNNIGANSNSSSSSALILGGASSGANNNANATTGGAMSAAVIISQFCDFCLGDAQQNKKTMRAEELIACKDCGRCGHPTCLQFTPNMIISTKRHGWQCIDCKSCAVCGTSENDDQLLFCDDCDRGFHMYCLKPPLLAAPEGNWSCHLCIVEFGPAASNPSS